MMSNCPKRHNDEENDGSINFASYESSSINFVSRESTEPNAKNFVRIDMNFFPFRPPPSRRITQEFFDGPDPVHFSAEAPVPYDDVFHPTDGQGEEGELTEGGATICHDEGGEPNEGGAPTTQDSVFSRRPNESLMYGNRQHRNIKQTD